ncbi:hypothetical protein CB0940_06550 [Cercospora beticola]|uniref:Methylated-DNA-[protein]-cysteine S-methyltransferase DNA binding domain-containing protein n=1 Tax=Cercospora beticola TaxID=122368 RepID=A0A2G5HYI5_CERBT|nr:hypothetical protein CB0940_06550 [Cercospora beticola]PIA97343.1 hypothetical protein CB0940_06550 [Cercospora beticola]
MPRSDEAASWYTMVYRAVQQVPYGSVTSYGHIATLLGYPSVSAKLASASSICPAQQTSQTLATTATRSLGSE